jgi:hypothetical protein
VNRHLHREEEEEEEEQEEEEEKEEKEEKDGIIVNVLGRDESFVVFGLLG